MIAFTRGKNFPLPITHFPRASVLRFDAKNKARQKAWLWKT
jgi:hypothetical protein